MTKIFSFVFFVFFIKISQGIELKSINSAPSSSAISSNQASVNPLAINQPVNTNTTTSVQNINKTEAKSSFTGASSINYISTDRSYKGADNIKQKQDTESAATEGATSTTKVAQNTGNEKKTTSELIAGYINQLHQKGLFLLFFESSGSKKDPSAPEEEIINPSDPTPTPINIRKQGPYISDTSGIPSIFVDSQSFYNLLNNGPHKTGPAGLGTVYFSPFYSSSTIGTKIQSTGSGVFIQNIMTPTGQVFLYEQNNSMLYNFNNGSLSFNGNTQRTLIGTPSNPLDLTSWMLSTSFVPGNTGNGPNSPDMNHTVKNNFNLPDMATNANNPNATSKMYVVVSADLTNITSDIQGARVIVTNLQTTTSNNVFFANIRSMNNNILNTTSTGPSSQAIAFLDYNNRPNLLPGTGGYVTQSQAQYFILNDNSASVNTGIYTTKDYASGDFMSASGSNVYIPEMNIMKNGFFKMAEAHSFNNLTNGTYSYTGSIEGYAQPLDSLTNLKNLSSQNLQDSIYSLSGNFNLSFHYQNGVSAFTGTQNININNQAKDIISVNMVIDQAKTTEYVIQGTLTAANASTILTNPITAGTAVNPNANVNSFNVVNATQNGSNIIMSSNFSAKGASGENLIGVSIGTGNLIK